MSDTSRLKKLFRHVIIARSGIYPYKAIEMAMLGLSLKDAPEVKDIYNVYRPASVLVRDKQMFTNMYVTYNHPKEFLNNDNYKDFEVGFTSNDIDVETIPEIDEICLVGSLSLTGNEAIEAYESGMDNVSPGYDANFIWQQGTTAKGELYDVVMTGIKEEANHLALCERARGGNEVKITDSIEGGTTMPKIFSGIWRALRFIATGVKDADMGAFKTSLEDVIKNRSSLTDEELAKKVEELKAFIADLPESDGKNQLIKIISDLPTQIKSLDDTSAQQLSAGMVDLFQKLDTEAMKDADVLKKEQTPQTATSPAPQTTGSPGPVKDVDLTPEKAMYIVQEIAKLISGQASTPAADCKPRDAEPTEEEKAKIEAEKKAKAESKAKDDAEALKKAEEEKKKKEEDEKAKGATDSMDNNAIDNTSSGIDPTQEWFNKKMKNGGKK